MSLIATPTRERKPLAELSTSKENVDPVPTSVRKKEKYKQNDFSTSTLTSSNEENVKVVIRVKPIPPENTRIWKVIPEHNIIKQTVSSLKSNYNLHENSESAFSFDKIYDESSHTQTIYEDTVQDIVQSVVQDGKHGTVFSYGQTGSGKTFTMQGVNSYSSINAMSDADDHNNGIVLMAAQDIFESVQKQSKISFVDTIQTKKEFSVRISFMEIYNEEVRDLLKSSSNIQNNNMRASLSSFSSSYSTQSLTIREDPNRGVFVEGLTETPVTDLESVHDLLRLGERNRSVASTLMNERSSRSHTIFRITVESRTKKQVGNMDLESKCEGEGGKENENSNILASEYPGSNRSIFKRKRSSQAQCSLSGYDRVSVAALNLVDLAGSERSSQTGTSGLRQKEGAKINQSLLTLSRVIMGLIQENTSHINFRDSKLTRILQPSLSGNARMAVICCVSPSDIYREETRSTLQFASRAKLIKTKAEINEVLMVGNNNTGFCDQRQEMMLLKQEQQQTVRRLSEEKNRYEKEMKTIIEKYESLRKFALFVPSSNVPMHRNDERIRPSSFLRRKTIDNVPNQNRKRKKKARYSDGLPNVNKFKSEYNSELSEQMNDMQNLERRLKIHEENNNINSVSMQHLFKNNEQNSIKNDEMAVNECALLRLALRIKSKEAEALQSEVVYLQKEKDVYEENVEDEIRDLRRENKRISSILDETKTTLERKDQELKNEVETKKKTAEALEQKDQELKNEVEANKKTVEDLLGQKAEALDWVEELLRENEELQEKIVLVEDRQHKENESCQKRALDMKTQKTIDLLNTQKSPIEKQSRRSESIGTKSEDLNGIEFSDSMSSLSYSPDKNDPDMEAKIQDLELQKHRFFEAVEKSVLDTPIADAKRSSSLFPISETIGDVVLNLAKNHDQAIFDIRIQTQIDDMTTNIHKINNLLSHFEQFDRFIADETQDKGLEKNHFETDEEKPKGDFEYKIESAVADSEKIWKRLSSVLTAMKNLESETDLKLQHLIEEKKFLTQDLKDSYAEMKRMNDASQTEINKLKTSSEELEKKLGKSIAEKNKLEQEVKEMDAKKDILKVEKDGAFTQIRGLLAAADNRQKLLTSLTNRNEDLEDRINHFELEEGKKKNHVHELEELLDFAQQEAETMCREKDDLETRLQNVVAENKSLAAEMKEFEKLLNNTIEEKEKLRVSVLSENRDFAKNRQIERNVLSSRVKGHEDMKENIRMKAWEIKSSLDALLGSLAYRSGIRKYETRNNIFDMVPVVFQKNWAMENEEEAIKTLYDSEKIVGILSKNLLTLLNKISNMQIEISGLNQDNGRLLADLSSLAIKQSDTLVELDLRNSREADINNHISNLIVSIADLTDEDENAIAENSKQNSSIIKNIENLKYVFDARINQFKGELRAQAEATQRAHDVFTAKWTDQEQERETAISKLQELMRCSEESDKEYSALEAKLLQERENTEVIKNEHSNLLIINKSLDEKVASIQKELDDVFFEKKQVQESFEKTPDNLQETLKEEISSLTMKYNEADETISELKAIIEQNRISTLSEIKALKLEKDHAIALLKQSQDKPEISTQQESIIENLQARIEMLQKEKQDIEQSIETYLKQHESEQEKKESMVLELVQSNQEMKELIKAKEREHKSVIEKHDSMMSDLRSLHKKKVKILTDDNNDLQEKIPELEANIQDWKTSFDEMNQEMDEFERCIHTLLDEKAKLNVLCESLSEDLREQKYEKEAKEKKIKNIVAELEQMKSDLLAVTAAKEVAESKIEDFVMQQELREAKKRKRLFGLHSKFCRG